MLGFHPISSQPISALTPAAAGDITGTGALNAQASDITGAGISSSSGSGALNAQASDITGVGLSTSLGSGALNAQASVIDGVGEVTGGDITGSGALNAQPSVIAGVGTVSGGVVEQPSGGWPVRYKKWPLPPPTFPAEVPNAEVLAFGDTPATKNIPSWLKTPPRRRGGLYIPRTVRRIERPSPAPRRVSRRTPTPAEAERGVTADEVIRRWKRREEENFVLSMIMEEEL